MSAVGVLPEDRGGGAAAFLMSSVLRETREMGFPLSTLFPSNLRLYRKVGYEHGGTACRIAVPARSLPLGDRSFPVRAVDPEDHDALREVHREWASRNNGNLDRNEALWRSVVAAHKHRKFSYLVGPEDAPEGHVVFHQSPVKGGFDLVVRDMSALTPAATSRLLTFLADHRSLAKDVSWTAPASDPLLLLLPGCDWRVAGNEHWLLRVTDVPAALSARGYPEGVEGELTLRIEDDVIPENAGGWTLAVEGGRGEARPGGREDIGMHVRTLAPLYTGLHSATELRRLGFLEGDDEAVGVADRLFAGSEPWMPDHF